MTALLDLDRPLRPGDRIEGDSVSGTVGTCRYLAAHQVVASLATDDGRLCSVRITADRVEVVAADDATAIAAGVLTGRRMLGLSDTRITHILAAAVLAQPATTPP